MTQDNVPDPGFSSTQIGINAIEFQDPTTLSRVLTRVILLLGFGIGVAATDQAIQASIDRDATTVTNYPPYESFVILMIALSAGLFAALAITWWRWQTLLFRNTTSLKAANRYGPRWVKLGWLVPGPWFYIPKRMIDDAYFPGGRPGGASSDLITGWWGLGWAMVTLILVSTVSAMDPSTRTVLSVGLLGVGVGLIGTTVAVIERIASGQVLRHGRLTGFASTPTRLHSISWTAIASGATVGLGVLSCLAIGYGYSFDTSQPTPSATASISAMSPGDCFNGDANTAATVVSCDGFHDGQLIGQLEVPATTYPGVEALTLFTQTGCYEQYEAFSGIGSQTSSASLLLVAPDETAWSNDIRTAFCVLGSSPPRPMRLSAENRAARSPLADLRPDDCYVRDPGFLTFRGVDCSVDGSFEVVSILQLSLLVDAAYPTNISEIATSACPPPRIAFPPDAQQWVIGQRYMLCSS